jgi:hypothetical protein
MAVRMSDVGLLGCNAVWTCKYIPELKMEAICSSEMLVSTYKTTCRNNPQYQHRHVYHC